MSTALVSAFYDVNDVLYKVSSRVVFFFILKRENNRIYSFCDVSKVEAFVRGD